MCQSRFNLVRSVTLTVVTFFFRALARAPWASLLGSGSDPLLFLTPYIECLFFFICLELSSFDRDIFGSARRGRSNS